MSRLLFFLFCSLPAAVWAAEPLNWLLLPVPGVINLKQGEPDDGMALQLLRALEPGLALRGVQVSYELGNVARLLQHLQQGRQLCSAVTLRSPERDRLAVFVPLLAVPPLQLVVRSADRGRVPLENGQVAWQALLDSDLRGAVYSQRIYPPALLASMQQALQDGRLQPLTLSGNVDKHLLMLSHGRFDFTLEFPLVLSQVQRSGRLLAPLSLLPLTHLEQMDVAGSYCTRSPWGRRMAQRIDEALRELIQAQDLESLYRQWLPADNYQAYQVSIKSYLRQRSLQPTHLE